MDEDEEKHSSSYPDTRCRSGLLPRHLLIALILNGMMIILLFPGCNSSLLQLIFDGADNPPPPRQRVRRNLLQEIDVLKRQLVQADAREAARAAAQTGVEKTIDPIQEAASWEDILELLPKDVVGQVDWVAALNTGVVAPRSGLKTSAVSQMVLDLDVHLSAGDSKVFSVVFTHGPHTQWLSCWNCHPGIFSLKSGRDAVRIDMAKIAKGQYCGRCHQGIAFGVEDGCFRCHTSIPASSERWPAGTPQLAIEQLETWDEVSAQLPKDMAGGDDWIEAMEKGIIAPRAAPDPEAPDEMVFELDLELVPDGNPMFAAVFSHQAHTSLLSCQNCHPAIFQMASGTTSITMDSMSEGENCGKCHGKVAFDVTGCPLCHPVLAG